MRVRECVWFWLGHRCRCRCMGSFYYFHFIFFFRSLFHSLVPLLQSCCYNYNQENIVFNTHITFIISLLCVYLPFNDSFSLNFRFIFLALVWRVHFRGTARTHTQISDMPRFRECITVEIHEFENCNEIVKHSHNWISLRKLRMRSIRLVLAIFFLTFQLLNGFSMTFDHELLFLQFVESYVLVYVTNRANSAFHMFIYVMSLCVRVCIHVVVWLCTRIASTRSHTQKKENFAITNRHSPKKNKTKILSFYEAKMKTKYIAKHQPRKRRELEKELCTKHASQYIYIRWFAKRVQLCTFCSCVVIVVVALETITHSLAHSLRCSSTDHSFSLPLLPLSVPPSPPSLFLSHARTLTPFVRSTHNTEQ